MNRAQGGARGGAGDGARTRTRAARARTRTHTVRCGATHSLSLFLGCDRELIAHASSMIIMTQYTFTWGAQALLLGNPQHTQITNNKSQTGCRVADGMRTTIERRHERERTRSR
jgi:hypothetical protein